MSRFILVLSVFLILPTGVSAAPAPPPADPDISSIPPDLQTPPMTEGKPEAGKRVRQTLHEYQGTQVYHALYLPADWQPGRLYPVLVEYAGNGPYGNKYGDVSTGKVEGSNLGYGISAGKGFIWVCMPYVDAKEKKNQTRWWGDADATVDYGVKTVRRVCEEFGGDPAAVILAGFSRGAIACGYLGLRNDRIADVWLAFVPYSHYDGVIETWPYPGADRASAIARLKRLKGRASFISAEGAGSGAGAAEPYLASTGVQAPFTFQPTGFRNHNDAWTLRDSPARAALRKWLQDVLDKRPGTHAVRGRVTDGDGRPVAGVRLQGGETHWTFTDDGGRYELRSLIDGPRRIVASKAGLAFTPADRAVTLAGKDLENADFTAGPEAAVVATGAENPDLAPLDRLMTAFLVEHKVPGAALAVTKNGRLVYARGFGYADVETRRPVQPASLFRIASVSKPITAAAVLQLVEQGKLKLDDKVFDLLKFQPHLEKGAAADPRLRQVTVLNLLQHTGGWDRAKSFDPMFRSVPIAQALGVTPPAQPEHIIRYMMGQPLQFDPGSRYAYSNFGYSLLGRVIEAVSGQPYEAYVRKHVLAPLGIIDMQIGKTLPAGCAPAEVKYYDLKNATGPAVVGEKLGASVPMPYGAWYLEGFDAHGGWIASAVDLVRFAADFDDPERSKLLRPETLAKMFARPAATLGYEADGKPKAAYYACGWNVRPVGKGESNNHWHIGGLAGTSTLLVGRHDGLDWAVLFNSGADPAGKPLASAIDSRVHKAVDEVKRWPAGDLFEKYLPP